MTIALPTRLTFLRILLAIIYSVLANLTGLNWAGPVALAVFIIASITDKIDGQIARKTNQVTTLGAFLDPLADKMLVNLAFLTLVYHGVIPLFVFAIVLVRDLAVDGLRMLASNKKAVIAASFAGKAKTAIQMISLIIIQLGQIVPFFAIQLTGNILLYLGLALTIYSGIKYFYDNRKMLTK